MRTKILLLFFFFTTASFAQNWERCLDLPEINVYSIANNHDAFLIISDSLIFKSNDNGKTWFNTFNPTSSYLIKIFYNNNYFYIGTYDKGIFRSSDNGISWENFSLNQNLRYISDFAVIGDSLFAGSGGEGVFLLNLKNPIKWESFNDGLFQFGVISLFAKDKTLFSGIGSYVFRRNIPGFWSVSMLDSTKQLSGLKFAALGNFIFAGSDDGIYRSSDNGESWIKVGLRMLPGLAVETFVIDKNRIYAGVNYKSDHFIVSSDNYGDLWEVRSHEFASLMDLSIIDNKLYAGRSDGLWYYNLDYWTHLDETKQALNKFEVSQNYPNPFNSETNINYFLPEDGVVKIIVYDIVGKEVYRNIEYKLEGKQNIKINLNNFSSGTYFYQISFNDINLYNKMILLK